MLSIWDLNSSLITTKYNMFFPFSRSFDPSKWVAFGGPAGPSNSTEDGLNEESQIRVVRRLITPPSTRQDQGFVVDDVILVELLDPFQYSAALRGICMAEAELQPGQLCVTAGWDKTKDGGANSQMTVLAEKCSFTLNLFFPQVSSSPSTWSTCLFRPSPSQSATRPSTTTDFSTAIASCAPEPETREMPAR